jgi:energy-coupling factor transporter ATP-binding protein EcfA2
LNITKETKTSNVCNDSFYNASEIIKQKKYVIISGIPGIGKTTLARILVFHYLAEGFEEFVYLSDSIDDAYTYFKEGKKQIFLFDDFLGTNFLENKLDTNEEKKIVRFIEKVSKSKDKIIIFTTREYILAQAKQKYDVFDDPSLEFAKCIIDLSLYTKIVRAKILYNHLYFSNLPFEYIENLIKNHRYKDIIEHRNYNPRIILTVINAGIQKSIKAEDFSTKFIEFIKNPESIWKHVFENQISFLSQIILVNLLSAGSPILLEDLKVIVQDFCKEYSLKYNITFNELLFKKSIRELENTFISIKKDGSNRFKIEYQNPSVQDFLVFYFRDYSDYITDILKIARNFNQFFTVFSFKEDFNYTISNRILLSEEHCNIVIDRICADFDYLNTTTLKRYSNSFEKEHFSDFIKLNEILKIIDVENYPNLKTLIIKRFKEIMFEGKNQLHSDEINSYINIVEHFSDEFKCNIEKMLNKVAESIIDLQEFEEFERFENIYGEEYLEIITNDELHKHRISTLMLLQAEYEEECLEELLDEYGIRAKKYNIDFSTIKNTIEEKIADKKPKKDLGFNWETERQKRLEAQEKEDGLIKNIFDSFKTLEKNDT